MEAQTQNKKLSGKKLILILPVAAIMIFAAYSCGKNTNNESAISGIAPPPPTPPADPVFCGSGYLASISWRRPGNFELYYK